MLPSADFLNIPENPESSARQRHEDKKGNIKTNGGAENQEIMEESSLGKYLEESVVGGFPHGKVSLATIHTSLLFTPCTIAALTNARMQRTNARTH